MDSWRGDGLFHQGGKDEQGAQTYNSGLAALGPLTGSEDLTKHLIFMNPNLQNIVAMYHTELCRGHMT